jgi:predicted adenine nucleotide alpha hydrolase (AANH) superfamily ATPase
MPSSKEYRLRAIECLELLNEPNEWYVSAALLELAQEFRKRAEKIERTDEQGSRCWLGHHSQ